MPTLPHLLCIFGAATESPEVTGSASIVPTSTSSGQSTVTPKTSLSGGSDTGVIAGSVVGGVIGVALIAGLVTWFTIRRIRARSAPPAEYSSGQGSDMAVVPYSQDTRMPKLYVSLFFFHPATVKAHRSRSVLTDLSIALHRTLLTQAHIQRMCPPQRSSQRTQADNISVLRPTYNPPRGYTAACRRFEGPNLVSPIHPSFVLFQAPNTFTRDFLSSCQLYRIIPRSLYLWSWAMTHG